MAVQTPSIFLKEALDIMARVDVQGQAIPFDCQIRTFNRGTKKGGKLKTYTGAQLLPLSYGSEFKHKQESIGSLQHIPKSAKNPNHFENRTRNIKTNTGLPRTINLNYLITLNGIQVSY